MERQISKLRILSLISCILFLFTCAKKMLPPSPDRFPPHLSEINPINRIKIDLIFDEDINLSKITNMSFTINSYNEETLKIRTVSRGSNAQTISLFTEPTKSEVYYLSGTFEDKSGNPSSVSNKKFHASTYMDTIKPKINAVSPAINTTKKYKRIFFDFSFSKPMDTTSGINFLVYPLDKMKINWSWSTGWQNLIFTYPDSLEPKTNVYFILQPTIKDLEGNQLDLVGYTFFTSETVQPPALITGNIYYQNKPYKNSIVILSADEKTSALAVSDNLGKFTTRLVKGIYNITAIADTNFDNLIDLFADYNNFNTDDTIKPQLNLTPVLESKEIDSYIR